MKQVYHSLLLTFFFIFAFTANSFASHLLGADVTYECIGPNQYRVTLQLYRDCNGVTPLANQSINVSSTSCGASFSVAMSQVGTPTDITPVCPSEPSGCGSSGPYGIESYLYQGIVNLPPGCGNDWILGWSQCCRNAAINTLNNPDNQDMYVSTSIDNTISPVCNSSPVFNNAPGAIVCINQPIVYNHGVSDPDGDSLFFAFGPCYQSSTNTVVYSGGYNGGNPLSTVSGISIDPNTGAITFTPNQIQIGVLCVVVQEYRNGVLIGEVNRDMQFSVINCSNIPPEASGINGAANNDPINFELEACAGSEVCFTIDMSDPNGNNVTGSWNAEIPDATFTVTNNGTTNPQGQFCWAPSLSDIGQHFFTVNVIDDNCPIIGNGTYTYIVDVLPSPNTIDAGPDETICFGESVTLTASSTGALSYTWTPSTGLSLTTGASVTASPFNTTAYTVTGSFPDGCDVADEVIVNIAPNPSVVIDPQSVFTCNGSQVQLTANSATATSYLWSNSDVTQMTTVSPVATTDYWVTVTDANGCSSTDTSTVNIAQPTSTACNVLYVSTTGVPTNEGTQASPLDLQTALERGACNGTILKMATGDYVTDTAITRITSYITLEGGFQEGLNWDKISTPGATRILRTATANNTLVENVTDETGLAPRVIAIEINGQTGFRFQDITIEVEDLVTASPGNRGISTYGVHLTNCADYNFTRTQIIAGNASAGGNGSNGASGVNGGNGGNGQAGDEDDEDDPGNGGNGGNGSGAGSGAGGIGGNSSAGAIGTTSSNPQSGGGGGGGGAGGEDANNFNGRTGGNGGGTTLLTGPVGGNGGSGGNPGNSGNNGGNGINGGNGANGLVGAAGNVVGNYFQPGGQGGTGLPGNGGTGGAGGGGGGGQDVFIGFDGGGNGGGGGGGGGQGGFGGTGGLGGGSSYGLFVVNNIGGTLQDIAAQSGTPGAGGNGGNGGSGGNGGNGGNGSNHDCSGGGAEIGCGGDGGDGGDGGNGGNGGNGASGNNMDIFVASGIAPDYFIGANNIGVGSGNPTRFNFAAQPVINMEDVSCTAINMDFDGPNSQTWDLGLNSTPNTPTGAVVTTQYSSLGRKDIAFGANEYSGFANIILDAGVPLDINTSAPFINGAYRICSGSTANFTAIGGGVGYVYNWTFEGPSAPPPPTNAINTTDVTTNDLPFNTPGEHLVILSYTSNCCGSLAPDTLTLFVEEQPILSLNPVSATICEGEGTPVLLTADDQINFGSISWSVIQGLDDPNAFTVNALPGSSTNYNVVVTDSTGLCADNGVLPVTVVDLVLTTSTTDANCGPDGSATVVVTGGSGNYSYQWNDASNQTTATASNVQIGTYTVVVTDNVSGCMDSAFAAVGGTAPVAFISGGNAVSCFGGADGSLTVSVINGTPPFVFSWSPGGAVTQTINNLTEGTYQVTATDANGCAYVAAGYVAEPPPLQILLDSLYEPLCATDPNGYISVLIDGGTSPYSYLWDDPAATTFNELTGVVPGTYCLSTTDGNGCMIDTCFVLGFEQTIDTIIDTICAMDSYTFPSGITIVPMNDTLAVDTLTTPFGCDSLVFTNLTVNPSYNFVLNDTICIGDVFTMPSGLMYAPNSDTVIIDSLITNLGCDSLYTVNLQVDEFISVVIDTVLCEGQNLTVNGNIYTDSGNYLDTAFYNLSGCDSVHYDISIQVDSVEQVIVDTVICQGEVVSINGVNYNQTGNYLDTAFYTGSGCDSIQYDITVQVDSFVIELIDTTICEGESLTVNGVNYNIAGSYLDTSFYSSSGCDSVQYQIQLQIDSVTPVLIDTVICQGEAITVNGTTYTATGNYLDTAYFDSGCDSIHYNINLTIDSFVVNQIDTTICEGDFITVNGVNYNGSGTYFDTLSHTSSSCDSIQYVINLTVDSVQEIMIDTSLCAGDSVPVNGVWYDATGLYFDTLRYAQSNCDSVRFTVDLTINPLPNVIANTNAADSSSCANQTIALFGSGTAGVVYNWDNGVMDNLPFNPVVGNTTYIVTGTDANGCESSDTINITGHPTFAFAENVSICEDETYTLPNGTTVNTTGTYASNLTTVNGCDSVITTNLTVHQIGTFTPIEDQDVCSGFSTVFETDASNMIQFEWFVNEGSGYVSLLDSSLYFGADSNALVVPLDTVRNGNLYLLSMVDECGNVFNDTVALGVFTAEPLANPFPDTTFCLHEVDIITVNYNGYNYVWDDGSSGSSILPTSSGDYIVNFVENGTNCLMSDTINITLIDCIANCVVLAPTGFTPDQSGMNDVFRAVTTCEEGFASFQFNVYNRWGELVYSTNDPDEGWDGTYKGRNAEIGTYTYFIEYVKNLTNEKEMLKGTVTLIR